MARVGPQRHRNKKKITTVIFLVSAAVSCIDLNDSTGSERNLQRQYKASNVFAGYVANNKVDTEDSQPNAFINF